MYTPLVQLAFPLTPRATLSAMPVLDNWRHEIYALAIASGKNQTEAGRECGYAEKWLWTHASRLSRNVTVQARITELREQFVNARLVDAKKLHIRWSEMFEADIGDIVNVDGAFKPIHEWPKVWRQMMSAMDVKEIFEPSKDGKDKAWDKIGQLVKMRFIEQSKLGELLGKHKAVDAFVAVKEEHLHLHLHAELEDKLANARAIAASLESPLQGVALQVVADNGADRETKP